MSVPEALEKAVEEGDNKLTAVYIAVLAVLLAICSIGDDDASKTAVRSNIQTANTYAFFQAKNIRQTDYEIAVDQIQVQLMDSSLPENARSFLRERMASYNAKISRYDSKPETGEGKKELLAKARSRTGSCASARSLFRFGASPFTNRNCFGVGVADYRRISSALGERGFGRGWNARID